MEPSVIKHARYASVDDVVAEQDHPGYEEVELGELLPDFFKVDLIWRRMDPATGANIPLGKPGFDPSVKVLVRKS